MNEVATTDLTHVVGGATGVSSRTLDQQTQLALTKLNSDLKDLATPQQSTNQQLMLMMTAMIASRR